MDARGKSRSRARGGVGSGTRLVLIACAGALLAWAIVPAGAGGQQYPVPTAAPPTVAPPTVAPPPPPAASRLPLLTPFPIVRIVGRTSRRGAKITRLTVRAVVGSDVVSRCLGASGRCPYRQRITRIRGTRGQIRTIHVRAFERSFRAGVLLRVYVVRAGRTGKFTSFRIRSRRAPMRNDSCVEDIVLRPVRCSGG